jgi:4-carboxymuconolactone decarboxylase
MTLSKPSNAAQQLIGSLAPKLVELTDRVLFDEIWERKELSKRDRSLITVAALIALNRPDQLRFHLNYAVQNGVKKEELIEAITHLAFYGGWPNAMSSISPTRRFGSLRGAQRRNFRLFLSLMPSESRLWSRNSAISTGPGT